MASPQRPIKRPPVLQTPSSAAQSHSDDASPAFVPSSGAAAAAGPPPGLSVQSPTAAGAAPAPPRKRGGQAQRRRKDNKRHEAAEVRRVEFSLPCSCHHTCCCVPHAAAVMQHGRPLPDQLWFCHVTPQSSCLSCTRQAHYVLDAVTRQWHCYMARMDDCILSNGNSPAPRRVGPMRARARAGGAARRPLP